MSEIDLTATEFVDHMQRAPYDDVSLKVLIEFCYPRIKDYIRGKYGNNNFYDTVPQDVFTRMVFEYPPKKPVDSPIAYICRATRNYISNMHNLKDNQTLELFENYECSPEYENDISFYDEIIDKAWRMLDEVSRKILFLYKCKKYKLKEIAELIEMNYGTVRTRASRAEKELKSLIQKLKDGEKQ